MNEVKCPQCGSEELDVIDTDGGIVDGIFVEVTECRECNAVFDVEAELINVAIK